jgi:hypothetical protein
MALARGSSLLARGEEELFPGVTWTGRPRGFLIAVVAQRLNVSRWTLIRRIKRGDIIAGRLADRGPYRIPASELERLEHQLHQLHQLHSLHQEAPRGRPTDVTSGERQEHGIRA